MRAVRSKNASSATFRSAGAGGATRDSRSSIARCSADVWKILLWNGRQSAANPFAISSFLIQTQLDERVVAQARHRSHRCPFPEDTGCCKLQRFVAALRTHERDFDIRLHDVFRSSNAFVWRFRCCELVLSQGVGLLAWRGHNRNMALPDIVVDKPVFD
jgi:hypothetical protein